MEWCAACCALVGEKGPIYVLRVLCELARAAWVLVHKALSQHTLAGAALCFVRARGSKRMFEQSCRRGRCHLLLRACAVASFFRVAAAAGDNVGGNNSTYLATETFASAPPAGLIGGLPIAFLTAIIAGGGCAAYGIINCVRQRRQRAAALGVLRTVTIMTPPGPSGGAGGGVQMQAIGRMVRGRPVGLPWPPKMGVARASSNGAPTAFAPFWPAGWDVAGAQPSAGSGMAEGDEQRRELESPVVGVPIAAMYM